MDEATRPQSSDSSSCDEFNQDPRRDAAAMAETRAVIPQVISYEEDS